MLEILAETQLFLLLPYWTMPLKESTLSNTALHTVEFSVIVQKYRFILWEIITICYI